MLKAKRALVLDHELFHWTQSFVKRLLDLGLEVTVLYVLKGRELNFQGVREIKLESLSPGLNEVNFSILEEFLSEGNFDLAFQHAFRTRKAIKIAEYFKNRNFFIDQGLLKLKPIDHFIFEGGLLRPGLEQLETDGVNFESELVDKKYSALSPDQDQILDSWLKEYRTAKRTAHFSSGGTGGTSEFLSREEVCKVLKIDPGKKIVFCPMQKPGDSVIREFAPWCNTPPEFVEKVIRLFRGRPEYHLIFRRHPQDKTQSECYRLLQLHAPSEISFVPPEWNEISSASFMEAAEMVCVVNSTAGCEALALGKVVIVLGYAAYGKCAIPFHRDDEDSVDTVFSEVEKYSRRKGLTRSFLYQVIQSSTGVRGKPLKELINQKSIHYFV